MEHTTNISEIQKMSIAERILIVEQIWDGIAEEQESIPLTETQREELERRLNAYHSSPDNVRTWDEVKRMCREAK